MIILQTKIAQGFIEDGTKTEAVQPGREINKYISPWGGMSLVERDLESQLEKRNQHQLICSLTSHPIYML